MPVVRKEVCPQCGGPLVRVRQSSGSVWSGDQFDANRAGDYFCEKCPDNQRGKSGLCYWWDRELPAVEDWQI